MVETVQRKVGIIACSGEELAEGTVTRLAALKVLHELRPGATVTICLPLFLAGGEGDRAFARNHPTITVDGCALRCAAQGTARYSAPPAASLVVSELVASLGLPCPRGRRRLDAAGQRAVDATSERLAALVDETLAAHRIAPGLPAPEPARESACSCGSGIPVLHLVIDGEPREVVALPLIIRKLHDSGRPLDDALTRELLDEVKIYNPVPPEAEASWKAAVVAAYAAYVAP